MKKVFSIFSCLLTIFLFSIREAKAVEWTSLQETFIGNPLGSVLSGENAGNQNSFSVNFNLSKLTESESSIDKASLSFYIGNPISSDLQIKNVFTNEVLGTSTLNTVGVVYLKDYEDLIKNWIEHPEENQGLIFTSNNLSASSRVNISAITITVSYKIIDKIPPQILSQRVIRGASNDNYFIELETNEPTKVELNYGKTSQYGEHRAINTDNTFHKFDLYFLEVGYSYHYQMVIKDLAGNVLKTPDSSFITGINLLNPINQVLVEESKLHPPTGVSVETSTSETKKGLIISFLPSESENVGGYVVFRRSFSDDDFIEIAQLDRNTQFYFDSNIEAGVTYYYKVRTMAGNEVSDSSKEVSFVVPKDFNLKTDVAWNDSRGNVLLALFSVALIIFLVVIVLIKTGKKMFSFLFPKKKDYKNKLRDPDSYFN